MDPTPPAPDADPPPRDPPSQSSGFSEIPTVLLPPGVAEGAGSDRAFTVGPGAPTAAGTPGAALALSRDFGKYEILEELGRGAMGAVYQARQKDLGRLVALKVLLSGEFASGEEVERFQREARAAAAVRHPNLVALHEVGCHAGLHYFTMDYIAGENLTRYARRVKPDPRAALELVRKVALGLSAAHEQGVIHRDVKPGNILVDARGEPVLTDFGLAKLAVGAARLTASGSAVGTPAYMAPEQAAGRLDEVDARSDVYSLGAVLYELLTGRPPFEAASVIETLYKVVNEELPPPRRLNRDVPAEVEALCLRAMERDRARRYRGPGAFAEDIGRYLAGEPTEARPTTALDRLARRLRRRARLVAAIAALAIALSLLAGWVSGRLEAGARARDEAERMRRAEEDRRRALASAEPVFREAEEAYQQADRLLYVKSAGAGAEICKAVATAVARSTDALAILPDFPDARLLRGKAHALAQRYDAAIEDFSALVRSHPELSTPYLERARVHVNRLAGLVGARAWTTGRKGIRMKEKHAEPPEAAEVRRQVREDLEVLRVRGIEPSAAIEVDALMALGAGEFARTVELLRDLPSGRVEAVALLELRAQSLLYLERYEDARRDLDAVLELQVNRRTAWSMRSLVRQALDDLPGALADADRALELDPADATALNNRGLLKRELGDLAGAIADYTAAMKVDAKLEVAGGANRGHALFRLGRFAEALADYDRCLAADPNQAHALLGRAATLMSLGRGQEGAGDLDRAVERMPDAAVAYVYRARLLRSTGQLGRAIEDLRTAVGLDPEDENAWQGLGEALRAHGDAEEALQAYGEALRVQPALAEAHLGRAQALQTLKRLDEALADYERLVRLRPDWVEGFVLRGTVRRDLGDGGGALEDFEHFLRSAPADHQAREQIGEWVDDLRGAAKEK